MVWSWVAGKAKPQLVLVVVLDISLSVSFLLIWWNVICASNCETGWNSPPKFAPWCWRRICFMSSDLCCCCCCCCCCWLLFSSRWQQSQQKRQHSIMKTSIKTIVAVAANGPETETRTQATSLTNKVDIQSNTKSNRPLKGSIFSNCCFRTSF